MSNELDLLKQLNLVSVDNDKSNSNEDAFDPLQLKNDFLNRLNNTSDKEELEAILKDVQSSKLDAYNKKDIIGKLLDKIKKDINNTNNKNNKVNNNDKATKDNQNTNKEISNKKENNDTDKISVEKNNEVNVKNSIKDKSEKKEKVNIDYNQIKDDIMKDMNINSLKEKSKKLEATREFFLEDEFKDIQNMLNNKIINMENILKKNKEIQKKKLEKEKLEKERLEKERLEKEKLEKERLEKERLEKERLEKEKLEINKEDNNDSDDNKIDDNREILLAKLKQRSKKKEEELSENIKDSDTSTESIDYNMEDNASRGLKDDNTRNNPLDNRNDHADKKDLLKGKIRAPKSKPEIKDNNTKSEKNSGVDRLNIIFNKVDEKTEDSKSIKSEDEDKGKDNKSIDTEDRENKNNQSIRDSLLSKNTNNPNSNIDLKKDKLKGMEILTSKSDTKEIKAAHIIEREKERENKLKREAELRVQRKLKEENNENESVFARITKSSNKPENNLPEISNEPVILAGRKKPVGQYKKNNKNNKVSEDDVLERDLSVIEFNYDESDDGYDGYYEDVLPIDHDVDQSNATLIKLIVLTVGIISFLGFLIFLFMKYIVLN